MSKSEAFKNVMTGLAAIAVPVTVAYVGNYFAVATKDKDVGVKFVELAVGILSKEPTKADANVRKWATRILEKYAGVDLDEQARQDIINDVPLPSIVETPLPEGSRNASGPRVINRIIIRDTQQDDLQEELKGLRTGRVAYHYLIAKDGTTHRLVDEAKVAFHTARNNEDSIGIGILHTSGTDYTQQQIDTLVELLSNIMRRRSIQKTNVLSASDVDPSKPSDFPRIRENVLTRVDMGLQSSRPR